MAKKDFETFSLENGAEVILAPKSDSLATTIMATTTVGSKYEQKKISGISHFLEHMAFKGTEKRPDPIDITTELESLGASYNASTGHEKTSYYAKVRNEHFDEALDIISDMYLNPTLPADELKKERGVILEEINMYEDDPKIDINDVFIKTLYGDQPAGWSILGTKDIIKSLERKDLVNYRKKHYNSGNAIITVAGGYDKKSVKEKLESTFSEIEKGKEIKVPAVKESQDKPKETIKYKDSDQSHLALGFRAFDIHDKREFTLKVLNNILGGGLSSRLFEEIREKRGLAYYVFSRSNLYTNNGFIAARAGVNKEKIDESIQIILKEFRKLKEDLVDDKELEKAKENIIGRSFLSLETSSSLASFYTIQRVRKLDPMTPKEFEEAVKSVTAEDIKSVANDLFTEDRLNLAVIGPFKDKSFADLLKI